MTAFRYINDGYAALPDGEAPRLNCNSRERRIAKDFSPIRHCCEWG
jgi:hypothetical protein